MTDRDYSYCKVFVNGDGPRELPSAPGLEIAIIFPRRSSGRLISGRTVNCMIEVL